MDVEPNLVPQGTGDGRRSRKEILAELRELVFGGSSGEPPPDPPASGLDDGDVFVLDESMLVETGLPRASEAPTVFQEYNLDDPTLHNDLLPPPQLMSEVSERTAAAKQKHLSVVRQRLTGALTSVRWGGRVVAEGLERLYTAKIPSWVAYSGFVGVVAGLCVLGAVKLGLFDQRTHEVAPAPPVAVAVPAGSASEWAQTLDHAVGPLAEKLQKLEARVDIHGQTINTQAGRIDTLSGRVGEVETKVRATTPVRPEEVLKAFRELQKQKESQGQKPLS
ncbi:MAG: hypothetical protein QG621_476 [Patescibacteria group bacterium]|nr:hypothetical protein [Patescibacteria group bacterium]